MRRVRLMVAGMLFLASFAAGTPSSRAWVSAPFCDHDIQEIVGFGARSQFRAHYEVFIPLYEKMCARAAGLVTFYSGDAATTFRRMLYRNSATDVDMFWGRDSALSPVEQLQVDEDTAALGGRPGQIGHFPIALQGIAVVYNLNCVSKPLNLSALNLSLIYLGQIKSWSDKKIVDDQPDPAVQDALQNHCAKNIKLTGRADNAGETTSFKTYMSKENPAWNTWAQPQLNTQWPSPLACRGGGDAGIAGCVASNSASIGYVSIQRAKSMGLRVANISRVHFDQAGFEDALASGDVAAVQGRAPDTDFVAPSAAGCTKAAESLQFPPGWDSYSQWGAISLSDAREGYPLCYFSFMFAFRDQSSAYNGGGAQASPSMSITLRDYLTVAMSDKAQKVLGAKGYGVVPRSILAINRAGIDAIQSSSGIPSDCPDGGQPIPQPGPPVWNHHYCFDFVEAAQDVVCPITTPAAGQELPLTCHHN